VRAHHQKRPHRQLPEAHLHTAVPGVPVPHEPRAAEGDERATYDPSERLRRHNPAEGERREDRDPDRQRVADGQGRKRAPHRARPPLLQPEGNGKEPARFLT